MRILFSPCHYIFDEVRTGSEVSWAFNIVDRIATKHSQSVVVCQSKKLLSKKPYQIIEVKKDKTEIDLGLKNAVWFNLASFLASLWQISKIKYDVMHHVLPFGIDVTFNLTILLRLTRNARVVIGPVQGPLEYTDAHPSWLLGFFRPLLKMLSQQTLLAADKIIAVNKYTQQLLVERGIPKKKVIIIPPGIDTNKYNVRKELRNTLQIITVGHLIKRKAVSLVLMALAETRNSKIRLIIVGDGPEKERLKLLAKKLNIQKLVSFVGAIPYSRVAPYYRRANLFVSMSRAESFGQVYLEAMASGLPVVTTINAGSKDIIKNGREGYLLEQENYHSLADRLNYLADNPDKIVLLGKNARQKTLERYDWQKVVIPKYYKVYEDLSSL